MAGEVNRSVDTSDCPHCEGTKIWRGVECRWCRTPSAPGMDGTVTFTPGPWVAEKPSQIWQINAGRTAVALVVECGGVHQDEPESNARMMSAAPDLYEALNAVLVMWDRGPCPKKLDQALSWRENDERAREMARAAIAKARGEE